MDEFATQLGSALSAIAGGLIALVATVLTARYQLKQNRENHSAAYKREQLQHERSHLENRLAKLEEAMKILYKLTREFSQTSSFITWSKDMTQEEYHNAYWETTRDLDHLGAIVSTHFGQLIGQFNHFSGATNSFFGYQQRLLYQSKELGVQSEATQSTNSEVVKAACKVEETSHDLMQGMADKALTLNQRMQAIQ